MLRLPIGSPIGEYRSRIRVNANAARINRCALLLMPVDSSMSDRATRRSKGEIACAECRRLKVKCDKQVPCSTCMRRGCSTICPNGTLSAGHGSRLILSDAEELHRKLMAMSDRIRQLEDALLAICPTGHPLLTEQLLGIKHGTESAVDEASATPSTHSASAPATADETVDALNESMGTLVISEGGSTRFIGTTGITANYLVNEDSTDPDPKASSIFEHLSETWPFYPIPDSFDRSALLAQLLTYLPTKERISALCEALFENLAWTARTVTRLQIIEEIVPSVLGHTFGPTPQSPVDFHELALLFMICSLGSIADLTQPTSNNGAYEYYILARAALSLKSVFEDATLTTIQTLHLINEYIHFLAKPKQQEVAWMTYNMVEALAISMGLHHDPSRWKLDANTSERRRRLFWEIFWMDSWKSIATGRPPFFSIADVDCQFPNPPVAPSEMEESEAFRFWYYKFGRDIGHPIAKRMMSAEPLKHTEVLGFDHQVREYPFYRSPIPADPQDSARKIFWASVPMSVREIALLYIHRAFFAKAMLRTSEDPLGGPYASSFLCTYNSALTIMKHVRSLFGLTPTLSTRCWFLWPHIFCALIVVSSVVALKPDLDIIPAGLAELALSVEMFEQATRYSEGLKKHLSVVLRLRSKAFKAYAENRNATLSEPRNVSADSDFSRELALLGGKTRSVYIKGTSNVAQALDQQIGTDTSSQFPSSAGSPASEAVTSSLSATLTSMIGSPSIFTSQPDLAQPYNDAPACPFGVQDMVAQASEPLSAPFSYSLPALQGFTEGDLLNTMAGNASNLENSPAGIPLDTWNDLLNHTGVYHDDRGQEADGDMEWALPDTYQDWM